MNKTGRHTERFAVLISLLLFAVFFLFPLVCYGSMEPLRVSVSGSGDQVCGATFSHVVEVAWSISGGIAPYSGSMMITKPSGEEETVTDLPSEGTRTFELDSPGGGSVSIRLDVTDSTDAHTSSTSQVTLEPCGTSEEAVPKEGGELPPFDFAIDPRVQPIQEFVQPSEDGDLRPVAALADPHGRVSSFVEDEILFQTNDAGVLGDFLARCDGKIVAEIDPAIAGLDALARIYLVRVNPACASLDSFVEHVTAISAANDRVASGLFRFSSERAARLIALAMAEAYAGNPVGVNWVGGGGAIPDWTIEGAVGVDIPGYVPDAYQWEHFRAGTAQDIGIPEAWSLLFHTGNLSNRVNIAVIDGGFSPNDDRVLWRYDSMVYDTAVIDSENSMTCGGGACPWHGSMVWSTAMAVPDNGFGAAGTSGPIGHSIIVYVGADIFSWTSGVIVAKEEGAEIINLSLGMSVPQIFDPTLMISEDVFESVHDDNTLIFAAAGNDGTDVDSEVCAPVGWPIPVERCFEETWYIPCENNGVICVGGLGWNSRYSDGQSNYGNDSVDIFAPFNGYVASDPELVDARGTAFSDAAQWMSGTSHASPYAAGVAALVWAADPDLSADEVWQILQETAHSRYPGAPVRWVNAYDAVLSALGTALFVEIDQPEMGATLAADLPVELAGRVTYVGEPGEVIDCAVTWSSSVEGAIAESTTPMVVGEGGIVTRPVFATAILSSAGEQTITLRARTMDPALAGEDEVSVNVGNVPPSVRITSPATGTEICQGDLVTLRGIAWDPNEPGSLPDAAFVWTSTIGYGSLGMGPIITTDDLMIGLHTITLEVTDSDGLPGRDSIELRVRSATSSQCAGNRGPRPQIIHPENGARYRATQQDADGLYFEYVTFEAAGNDDHDADDDLTYTWYVDGHYVGIGRVLADVIVYASASPRVIRVVVGDSDGATGEDEIQIVIEVLM